MKILFRGDAIAAGKGCSKSYINLIKVNNKNVGWEIIDKSHIIDNTFDANWTYETDIKPYRPDILVLHFGINDAYYPVYRSEFKENLVQLIRRVRIDFNSEILLITSHPFENIYDMEMVYIYYRTIREVAVDLHCHLLPLHTWFRSYCEENSVALNTLFQRDTRYPNQIGQELYSKAIELKLKSIITNMDEKK